jgi:hypothetical protein
MKLLKDASLSDVLQQIQSLQTLLYHFEHNSTSSILEVFAGSEVCENFAPKIQSIFVQNFFNAYICAMIPTKEYLSY